jgi:lipoyl(octanoyl) transferase
LPPATPRSLDVVWLGRAPYREACALQERLRAAVLDGSGAETLLLVEHPPTITLGRRGDARHVLLSESALGARGVEVVRASRGGDVTYHGPGQLVAYPVVRLDRGVVAHVEAMAAAVLDVVAPLGVAAAFRRDRPGVWVGDRKLCAFGVHVHRRVAVHGLALNVDVPAEPFGWIVPCGLRDAGVVSLAQLSSTVPPLGEIATRLAAALARRLGRVANFPSLGSDCRCLPDRGS